jgi:hypothetical protein
MLVIPSVDFQFKFFSLARPSTGLDGIGGLLRKFINLWAGRVRGFRIVSGDMIRGKIVVAVTK